jgi:MFS family permease
LGAGVGARSGTPVVRPANWWWNFSVLGGDIAFFTFGVNISSSYTIMPLFVHHLTPSNAVVALIPAVRALGLYGPQLLIAPLVERRQRALPLILVATIFERVPYLILALAALWLASSHAAALIVLFLVMVFTQQLGGGLAFPAWLDLIARTIPEDWRGRFLGWWSGVGGLFGIGGAALAAAVLAQVAWPLNFALIFGLTFAALVVSFILLALGREPARVVSDLSRRDSAILWDVRASVAGVARQVREVAGVVRGDSGLQGLVTANAVAGVATMSAGLYAISALRQGHLSPAQVGAESTVLVIASTLGNFLWGALGDRFGHRSVLIGASLCSAGAAALALGAKGFVPYALVFLLLGLSLSATFLSQLTFIADFAPPARRPTYIAFAFVAYAPFAIGGPILGGWMADRWGYSPVFLISIAAAAVAVVTYRFWVPQPRRQAEREVAARV